MICSRGTYRPRPPRSKNRGRPSGILTRAKRASPTSGSSAKIARESESPEMYGNGCPGPTASGVRIGKISRSNRLPELCELLRLEILDAADDDALGFERRAKLLLPESRLQCGQLEHALADARQRLLRREAVGGAHGEARFRLPEQPGDSHLEELVEVRREDPAVVDPLEQRAATRPSRARGRARGTRGARARG